MELKCSSCGTDNPADSRFCRQCAAPLRPAGPLDVTLPLTPSVSGVVPRPDAHGEDFPPGTVFAGRFRIIEPLGGGGMGRVYKALDTKVNEKVALKRILPEYAADGDMVARFSDELRLARRISHPNVCRVFDIGEADGAPYISMEYVAGEELKNVLRMTKCLSPGQTASIGKQIAAGLAEAHRLGVIHRDLKPQNIMIDREGTARIMDFGIARLSRADRGRTGRGVMIGTPEYMSPEQAEGAEVDARTDLYALGVMLFEMATGRLPFQAPTGVALAVKHKTELPPAPQSVNPRVPDDLNRLILRLLEKDPAERPPSAADVRDELELLEKEVPATSRVVSRRAKSTARHVTVAVPPLKKIFVPAAVVIGLGVLFLAGRLIFRRGGTAVPKIPNSIAVVGFENQTGDPKYDHLRKAIPELMITGLENTGRFQVTTWERMQDVLKQEGRGIPEIIDQEAGFEICRREGIASIVTGSFTKAGDTFATNVKLLDAESRKLLKSAAARGEGENSILRTQIDELSGEIVQGLTPAGAAGEPARPAVPVMDVTTKSMDAYAALLSGRDKYERYRYNDAAIDLERAVALDPEFASAHYYLGRIYRNMGDLKGMVEHFEKARANAGKASEKERLWIEAGYAGYVERDGDKQIAILNEAAKRFPREKTVWHDLGNALYVGRRYGQAVEAYLRAIELDQAYGAALNQLAYCYLEMGRHDDSASCLRTYSRFYPGDVNPIDSLAEVEYNRGRLAEAEAGYRKVVSMDPSFGADPRLAWMQALQEKYGEALETLGAWAGRGINDVDRSGALMLEGIILHLTGRERESLEALQAGRKLAAASGTTAVADLVEFWLRFDRADWAGSRVTLKRLTAPASGGSASQLLIPFDPILLDAALDVAQGDLASAQAGWTAAEKARAGNPNFEQLAEDDLRQLLRARILAADGDIAGAREILGRERPVPLLFMNASDLIAYVVPLEQDDLARLDVREERWENAIADYRSLTVITPGHSNRRPVHPIYHFRLARIYDQRGLAKEARAEFERFLKVMEKADRESPEMAEARKRLKEGP